MIIHKNAYKILHINELTFTQISQNLYPNLTCEFPIVRFERKHTLYQKDDLLLPILFIVELKIFCFKKSCVCACKFLVMQHKAYVLS